jgi:hypothetical protein
MGTQDADTERFTENIVRIVADALCPNHTWAFDWYDATPEDVARLAITALRDAGAAPVPTKKALYTRLWKRHSDGPECGL